MALQNLPLLEMKWKHRHQMLWELKHPQKRNLLNIHPRRRRHKNRRQHHQQ
jgi:hypothetical protein